MVGRRQFLKLAAAAFLLVSGCATFRGSSDLDEHQEELRRLLDDLAGNYGEQVRLRQSVDSYSHRRNWLRNDLLQLQDELRNELAPDEWAEVVAILNRTGKAVARSSVSGA